MGPARGDDADARMARACRQASFPISSFDTEQRYLWLNDEAVRVMGLPEAAVRGRVFPYGIPEDVSQRGLLRAMREVAETGGPVHYESYTRAPSGIREHAWNVELWPITDADGTLTAVGMAAFDSSEQAWARQRLAILDQAATSIGTTLDLDQTAHELAGLVVPRLADFASVDLRGEVLRGEEPADGATNRGVELHRVAHVSAPSGAPLGAIDLGAADAYPAFSPPAQALRTGEAVLTHSGDPDLDRWIDGAASRLARLRELNETVSSLMAVPLRARGTTLGVMVLLRTRRDRFTDEDFTLAKELASRAALSVDNARRYTRERVTALALQSSLLPQGPARHSAADVACRYRATDARAGVGGDWFDIIPLSGARVALVVGDVVGHGIQASATMGRLRTAVQTLADVDLPPDELLAHLDDLVVRLGGETAATCLYAVYDPVTRTLTAASAGHPPPVCVAPDRAARVVDISVGPMLGVGGLPFESVELELPEGSLLALYSDGLVEAVDHDPDLGIAQLCDVLEKTHSSLEDRCDQVLAAMLPEHPTDDVALVLARTKVLHADRIRTWNLMRDFAVVADARRYAVAQLEAWGLDEAGFVTELVVSELVTNAIRYGAEPIQLRLIHDRVLICEVSDGSSTSPHLRRAQTFDEGGRGLLLVAQLTADWGTRHATVGKTIWTEQVLSS
jgi:serine phosphatase RsbU (regulator of sigma subunit)/anti-sigma regulatory factor (Ser/Thr protein kinase)